VERYRALTWIFSQQAPPIAAVDRSPTQWSDSARGDAGISRNREPRDGPHPIVLYRGRRI